jgi:hypothetical protein
VNLILRILPIRSLVVERAFPNRSIMTVLNYGMYGLCIAAGLLMAQPEGYCESPDFQWELLHRAATESMPQSLKTRHKQFNPQYWTSTVFGVSGHQPILETRKIDRTIFVRNVSHDDNGLPLDLLNHASLGPVCDADKYSIWIINANPITPKTNDVSPPWDLESGFMIGRQFENSHISLAAPRAFDKFVGVGSKIQLDYCAVCPEMSIVLVSGGSIRFDVTMQSSPQKVIRSIFAFKINHDNTIIPILDERDEQN